MYRVGLCVISKIVSGIFTYFKLKCKWEFVAYAGLLVIALSMRLWDLGDQAIHHDESLHAVYSWYLAEGRGYIHNPLMHGPFQFIGTSLLYHFFGDTDTVARLMPAMFGTALVVIPALLRGYLGRAGALATSVLLTFSPTMLYFSRFARNDIFMAVWTLLLVAMLWRYLDSKRNRYLFLSAAILAFAFSTKETTFMLVAILGSYLTFLALHDVLPWLAGKKSLRNFSPVGDYLVLLATLSLPLLAPLISIPQTWIGITLANGDPALGAVGIPMGTGLYIAVFISASMIALAHIVGLRWRPGLWFVCFAIFASIWVILHTVMFTNLAGIASGLWQSLGYWLQQHEVCRGCQPWYYYLVIGFNYEFLAIIFSIPAIVYYTLRGNRFTRFLVYWAILTFLMYTIAGEKMPWLLVQVSLPLILLAGKLLGESAQTVMSIRLASEIHADTDPLNAAVLLVQYPENEAGERVSDRTYLHFALISGIASSLLVLVTIALLVFIRPDFALGWISYVFLGLIFLAFIIYLVFLKRIGMKRLLVPSLIFGLYAPMFILSVIGAIRLSYVNSDVPVEMLVYTQTSPDIPEILSEIDRLAEETDKGKSLRITVDSTDGFSWPWAWYLRNYTYVSFPCLSRETGCTALNEAPDADVVLLAARNQPGTTYYLAHLGAPVLYKHRWWFPESYRDLTLGKLWNGILDKESVQTVVDYFLFREFPMNRLGSVDAYAYFPKGFPSEIP